MTREWVSPEPSTLVFEDSDTLLDELAEAGDFSPEMLQSARQLLDRLAASGHVTRDPGARRDLRSKLTYWASEIRSSTGELVHPPPLFSPSDDGSGLDPLLPKAFVKAFSEGEKVDSREIQGARFKGGKRHFPSQYVGNSYLLNCNFEHFSVAGSTEIVASSLLICNLVAADVETLTANNSRFLGTELRRVTAAKVLFRKVRMPYSKVIRCSFPGAVFDDSNLAGGDSIDDSDRPDIRVFSLEDSEWDGATVFEEVDLSDASFGEGASLRGTTFVRCNLRGASFHRSDVAGAVFEDCEFNGDEFEGSINEEFAVVVSRTADIEGSPAGEATAG
jgi:uncharacterized protein YjbI with pentapeptide repeats